jgi:hypothetical protein
VSAQESHNISLEGAAYDTRGQGKAGLVMVPMPGFSSVVSNGTSDEVRGVITHSVELWAVVGNKVYQRTRDTTIVDVGLLNPSGSNATMGTSTGRVSMASSGDQGNQVVIADGSQIYVAYDKASSANITGITNGADTTITIPGHELVVGDAIYISGITDDGAGADTELEDALNGLLITVKTVNGDDITIETDTSSIDNVWASGGTVQRERLFSPGFSTDTGDETWTTASSEDNDSIGEAGATDAIAWTTPANGLDNNDTDTTAASCGQVDSSATLAGTGAGVDWTNPSEITNDDTTYATYVTGSPGNTTYLTGTNFGFSIPAAAQIIGYTITLQAHHTPGGASTGFLQALYLVVNGSQTGASWGTRSLSGGSTTYTFGGTFSLNGTSLTPSDINGSTFGFQCYFSGGQEGIGDAPPESDTINVDAYRINVHYIIPTDYLQVVDRSGSDLAATDVITGIEIDVHAHALTAADTLKYQSARLVLSGGATGNDKGSEGGNLPTTEAPATFGGTGDLWGLSGAELDPTVINSEGFGVQVSFTAQDTATASDTAHVDFINLKIYYRSSGAVAPDSVEWFDNYFLANDVGTGKFYHDNATGAQSWDNDNDFATAERDPDNLKAIKKKDREVWLVGERSSEAWYDSGSTFPFDPLPAGFIEKGTSSGQTVARHSKGLAWLTQDDRGSVQVISLEGQSMKTLSYPGMEYIFDRLTTKSDAFAFVFAESGHEYYILTFPTHKETWAYDFTTEAWSRWFTNGDGMRHLANCYAYWPELGNGTHIIGGYQDGTLYALTSDTATDAGSRVPRRRVSGHIHSGLLGNYQDMERRTLFYPQFELHLQKGHADIDEPSKPELERNRVGISWSDDDGRTFTDVRWRDIPAVGQNHRLLWNMLGSSRDRIFAIDLDIDIPVIVTGAYAFVEVGEY